MRLFVGLEVPEMLKRSAVEVRTGLPGALYTVEAEYPLIGEGRPPSPAEDATLCP